jgi:hypothetical protein
MNIGSAKVVAAAAVVVVVLVVVLVYMLTNRWASQEIFFLLKRKVHCRVHNSEQDESILRPHSLRL